MKKNSTMKKTADLTDRSFLGRDFLTWLWFRCEVEGGEFELELEGARGRVATAVMVEDALSLVQTDEDGAVMTLRKGTPTIRPEAASALGAGMTLRKARMFVAQGPREWQFTLDGETLDLGGVKTPDPEAAEGEEGEEASESPETVAESLEPEKKEKKKRRTPEDALDELREKLVSAEEVRSIVEALYRHFLDLRLAKDWDRIEVPRMRDWVGTKLKKAVLEVGVAN